MNTQINTPINLKAAREIFPSAATAEEGVKRMLTEKRFSIVTVARIINTYGGKIDTNQIALLRKKYKLVPSPPKRDTINLCSKCGLKPRSGRFLCTDCFLFAPADVERLPLHVGPASRALVDY